MHRKLTKSNLWSNPSIDRNLYMNANIDGYK